MPNYLLTLLGKSITDEDVEKFLNDIPGGHKIERSRSSIEIVFEDAGLDVYFNRKFNILHHISFVPNAVSDMAEKLPFELTPSDSRPQVLRKLGVPNRTLTRLNHFGDTDEERAKQVFLDGWQLEDKKEVLVEFIDDCPGMRQVLLRLVYDLEHAYLSVQSTPG